MLLVSGFVAGSTGSNGVEQTSGLPVEMGHPAQMDCSQDLGGEYLEMSEGLKLMADTVPSSSQPDFGELSHGKYSATKHEAERKVYSKGVYFFAVSTLAAVQIVVRVNKNHKRDTVTHGGNLSDLMEQSDKRQPYTTVYHEHVTGHTNNDLVNFPTSLEVVVFSTANTDRYLESSSADD